MAGMVSDWLCMMYACIYLCAEFACYVCRPYQCLLSYHLNNVLLYINSYIHACYNKCKIVYVFMYSAVLVLLFYFSQDITESHHLVAEA